jgi:AcrR family transcriptional regulator
MTKQQLSATTKAPVERSDRLQIGADTHALDPRLPVPPVFAQRGDGRQPPARQNQRRRRAVILASIRQLLLEEGYKGVTVRKIAELSGNVVQTVYNLVGPRDQALVEAIADYTSYVGRLAPVTPEDPAAVIKIIEWQGQSVLREPEFTRQVCLMYFTDGRRIFQQYRQRQIRDVHSILAKQKRVGVLRRDVNCRDVAQDLMFYSSVIFIEWADQAFPTGDLISRIRSGYAHILAGAVSPRHGGLSAMPF